MKRTELSSARAACAYFFLCPGLSYGLLTSRLPALKMQTGADESQIGLLLLFRYALKERPGENIDE